VPPLTPPPPPPPPPPPAAPRDVTAPTVSIGGATIQRLAPRVTVRVTCVSEPCTSRATATVRVPANRGRLARTYKLGPVTAKLVAKGKRTTLALPIGRTPRAAIRRALFARKRVVATITITVTDAAGNARKSTRKVRLKR
jgi:hypothetical protein